MRLTVRAVLSASELGDFSLRPQQGDVRAVFVPLKELQSQLDQSSLVNALLVSDGPGAAGHSSPPNSDLEALLKRHLHLEDIGLRRRDLVAQNAIALESPSGLIDSQRVALVEQAASSYRVTTTPVLTYLANSLRSGDRRVPYSLVTATDLQKIDPSLTPRPSGSTPIVINDWTAHDLGVRVGDPLTIDYYVWEDPGFLRARSADFVIADIVSIAGAAADRDLAPVYPGITSADTFGDWDPPFPIDLRRVRPVDEAYWKQYRTTPKAFISFEDGRRLWRSRFGDRTSIRILPGRVGSLGDIGVERDILSRADPSALGFGVQNRAIERAGRIEWLDGFRRILHLFQLLSRRLCRAARGAVLPAQRRAAVAGGRAAPSGRIHGTSRAASFCERGSVARARRERAGHRGGRGIRRGDDGRPARSLVGCGRHYRAHPSHLADFPHGRCGGCWCRGGAVYLVDPSGLSKLSERSLLAGDLRADDGVQRSRAGSSIAWLVTAIASAAAAAGLLVTAAQTNMDRTGAFFGAGTLLLIAALGALTYTLRRAGGRSERWFRAVAVGTTRCPQYHDAAWPERARRRRHRVRHLHPDCRRRLSASRSIDNGPSCRNGRLLAPRGFARAARPRSQPA